MYHSDSSLLANRSISLRIFRRSCEDGDLSGVQIMASFTTAMAFSALLCLCGLFAQVGAYEIDVSCQPYLGGQDKSNMIKAAMTEAKEMMMTAAFALIRPKPVFSIPTFDLPDTSGEDCFPGASGAETAVISGLSNLQLLLHVCVYV